MLCKALSHPARVRIVRKLLQGERLTVKEIADDLPLNRSTVSQHLKVLRDMYIVDCFEEYPHVYYSLNRDLPNTFVGLISLVWQSDSSYDEHYAEELPKIENRRMGGNAPK